MWASQTPAQCWLPPLRLLVTLGSCILPLVLGNQRNITKKNPTSKSNTLAPALALAPDPHPSTSKVCWPLQSGAGITASQGGCKEFAQIRKKQQQWQPQKCFAQSRFANKT